MVLEPQQIGGPTLIPYRMVGKNLFGALLFDPSNYSFPVPPGEGENPLVAAHSSGSPCICIYYCSWPN